MFIAEKVDCNDHKQSESVYLFIDHIMLVTWYQSISAVKNGQQWYQSTLIREKQLPFSAD